MSLSKALEQAMKYMKGEINTQRSNKGADFFFLISFSSYKVKHISKAKMHLIFHPWFYGNVLKLFNKMMEGNIRHPGVYSLKG